MPRRSMRTTLLNKSPLVKVNNSTPNSQAFVFESEPIKDPVSPNTTNLKASSAERKGSKKVRQRKIRYTQDLNVLMTDDADSDISNKTKSKPKRTKRNRLPSFLPPIDILEENKKRPLASANTSTDSENKENEHKDQKNSERVPRRPRRKRKTVPVKEGFIQTEIDESQNTAPSLSGNSFTDYKDTGSQSDDVLQKISKKPKRKKKKSVRKDHDQNEDNVGSPPLSGSCTDTDKKVIETKDKGLLGAIFCQSTKKNNSIMKKGLDQSNDDSRKEQIQDNTISTASSSIRQTASKSTLRREATFEIASEKSYIGRKTLNVSSPRPLNEKTVDELFDSIHMVETVDLTESVAEIRPSPRKLRRTFDKEPTNISLVSGSNSVVNRTNRQSPNENMKLSSIGRQSAFELSSIRENKISTGSKSSFEISFNFNKEAKTPTQVLDHLNITRRDSRNSNKKSNTGLQCSTEIEDNKGNFITLRRQCRSLVDLEGANCSSSEKEHNLKHYEISAKLNEGVEETSDMSLARKRLTKEPSPTKSILKSGRFTRGSRKIRMFDVTDCSNEALERSERRSVVDQFETRKVTPKNSQQVGAYRDIFDVVIDTPTVDLRHMLLDNVDSFALADSVAVNDTNRSRTFTMDDEAPKKTPARGRSSSRKRWSQVEKTPIFGTMPPCKEDEVQKKTPMGGQSSSGKPWSQVEKTPIFDKVPPSFRNDSKLDANLSVTKSVRFGTSPLILTSAQSQVKEKSKAKKSVKIESPLNTPKMRLHSPLVVRKTPKPYFSAAENSILASNCAYTSDSLISPFPTSTPIAKKKEISLLSEVLTNEKSKADKVIKSSSRVKMPNFRKIHERQFEKMENIKELQERKAVRAQYLLSGCKVPIAKNTLEDDEKESRKKLLFSPLNKNGQKIQKSAIPKLVKPEFKKRASLELKSKVLKNVNSFKSGQLQTICQQTCKVKNLSKPQQRLISKRASLDKKKPERVPETKPLSRFGFKQGTPVTKESQIKAVAAKSKPTVNRTEQNRKQTSSVRTNRRFELLMQFRGKK